MSLIKKHVPIGVLNKFGAVIHHDSGNVDEEAVVDMFYDYMANVDWRVNQ